VSADEFQALFTQLSCLNSLHIGNCDTWTSEVCQHLIKFIYIHFFYYFITHCMQASVFSSWAIPQK